MNERAATQSPAHALARDWRRLPFGLIALAAFVMLWPTDMARVGLVMVGVSFVVAGAVAWLRDRHLTSRGHGDSRFVPLVAAIVLRAIGLADLDVPAAH